MTSTDTNCWINLSQLPDSSPWDQKDETFKVKKSLSLTGCIYTLLACMGIHAFQFNTPLFYTLGSDRSSLANLDELLGNRIVRKTQKAWLKEKVLI